MKFFFYYPSDLLRDYKKLQLQQAILEYIALHNGDNQSSPEIFLDFAKHIDKTLLDHSYHFDITEEGNYLLAIKLLEIRDDRLFITDEGLKILQNLSLKTSTISTRMTYVSYVNWVLCTALSITAMLISMLK